MEHPVIIILDDDPTGTQTIHDRTVYLRWNASILAEAMRTAEGAFFLQTNSRALTPENTWNLHRQIAAQVAEAACAAQRDFLLVSRSESTLRGHFPLEIDALREGLRQKNVEIASVVLCPCFFEGHRYTLYGTHYIRSQDGLIPVGATEFAKDQTFGYHSSNLIEWIVEKSCGVVSPEDCTLLDVDAIRQDSAKAFFQQKLPRYVVVDGEKPSDMQSVANALLHAFSSGRRMLVRCAASLVQALCDQQSQPPLPTARLVDPDGRGGIVLVGSHVGKTNRQLRLLREVEGEWICFDVCRPLDEMAAEVANALHTTLAQGRLAVIYTSRQIEPCDDPQAALARAVQISHALAKVLETLSVRPRFLIAKGGITSYDVATLGLHVQRARVLGCAAMGIPVWQLEQESRFPGLPFIIFPGNVGEDDALLHLVKKLVEG